MDSFTFTTMKMVPMAGTNSIKLWIMMIIKMKNCENVIRLVEKCDINEKKSK